MKKWFLDVIAGCLFIVAMASTVSASGQSNVIQSVSASATVTDSTTILLVTGGSGVVITFPTASTGRTFSIVNQSTENVDFNVTVQYDNDNSYGFITHEAGAILPGTISNSITVFYDGTVWYKLN